MIDRTAAALLVIDVQERLFPHIDRNQELLRNLQKAVQGFQALRIPVLVTEQVPEKMGGTLPALNLPKGCPKSAFSAFKGLQFEGISEFVLAGIETHVCVLQTARDLVAAGYRVTVLRDCVGSRCREDYVSALEEMRPLGVRLSTVETLLFEVLKDAEAPEFRKIRDIVR